jgi:GH15 family glucan-1,4-alpha-glucosidase
VFLVGGTLDGRSFDEYSVGLFGIEGKEGTWKDAEDGALSKNPIEHGSVDSVIGFSMSLGQFSKAELVYWVCTGETYREVQALQRYVAMKSPARLSKSTEDYWHAWVNKTNFSFNGLSAEMIRLFKISLLVIRAHSDNRGGILASSDSGNNQRYVRDTYSYVWPRDGAYAALALDRAGYADISERFYAFCSDLITEDGYIMHKYQPDKSFGSSWHPWVKDGKPQLAIQEDETAILIFALWEHYSKTKDLEFVEKVYRGFIKLPAAFLMKFREPNTGLPGPSYDLWEEKFGISTYTAASVYGALVAAGKFAELLGKHEEKTILDREAAGIRAAILEHLYDKESGYFHKLVTIEELPMQTGLHDMPSHTGQTNGKITFDRTIDSSSFFGILKFGVLAADDPIMARAYDVLCKSAYSGEPLRGILRYVGDKYFSDNPASPGNPWFVTTLWALQYKISKATTHVEMEALGKELEHISSYALPSGIFSEQLDPVTGEQLSISPLVWSHAEFVTTVADFMDRMGKLDLGKIIL